MWRYIVRRLVGSGVVLLLVSIIVFTTVRALPGDTLLVKLGEAGQLSPEQEAAARAELGLDDPLFVAYGKWRSGSCARTSGIR